MKLPKVLQKKFSGRFETINFNLVAQNKKNFSQIKLRNKKTFCKWIIFFFKDCGSGCERSDLQLHWIWIVIGWVEP